MPNENVKLEPIRIVFAKGTDTGRKRDHNEDFLEALSPPDPARRQQKGELFIVADGMGGHQAGEVASESAVRTISREYYADPNPNVAAALSSAVQKANGVIHQRAQETPSQVGMGTTVVAAVARGNDLFLANVGDSRAYLLRNGQLRQITRDHSFVEEQIRAGILSREEARHHPQRNVITRALGAKPEVEVDTYGGTLVPGDTLLLCSDGLSEPVGEEGIAHVLKQHSPGEAVPRLIGLANSRGGSDNISALVVRAVSADTADPATAPTMPVPVTADTTADAPTAPGTPTAPAAEAETRRRLTTPVILSLGVGGVLLLAALAAGALFLAPTLMRGDPTPTPTPTPQPTAAEPTPLPTATPQAVEASTATPRMGFGSLEPEDGAVFAPGEEVYFRWSVVGRLPAIYESVVRTNHEAYPELCRASDEPCLLPEQPGSYQWWIELRSAGIVLLESDPRTLTIQDPSGDTPVPPPTATLPDSPQETPEDADGS